MLALARALVSRPRLLLLDEPSLGLAPTAVQEFFRVVRHLNQEEGLTVLVVEQNARIALASTQHAYVLEVGRVALERLDRGALPPRGRPRLLPRLLRADMTQFFQYVVVGLANGGVYATLALALVLIHRATGLVNFAQGEMGMFCTYIAWSLITHHGLPYWVAFFLTLVIAFLGGVGIHRVVIRPLSRAARDHGRDGDDRAARDPQRPGRLDLEPRGEVPRRARSR